MNSLLICNSPTPEGERVGQGAPAIPYRTAGAPSSRPSPPWGEGVKLGALTLATGIAFLVIPDQVGGGRGTARSPTEWIQLA